MQVVLRRLFERLGATYIKLGEQMLGSETHCYHDTSA